MASAADLAALRTQPALQSGTSPSVDPAQRSKVIDAYGKMPLAFEANQGQADPQAKFLSRGQGYEVFLTPTEAVLGLRVPEKRDDAKLSVKSVKNVTQSLDLKAPKFAMLGMKLKGANSNARVEGQGLLRIKSNYLIGNDRSKWVRHVPNYSEVKFAEVYPGIDLVYHGSDQGRLEYDFVVAPGADPSKIEISFDGAKGMKLNRNGDLAIKIAGGELIEHAPVIYQHDGDKRRTISGGYVLRGKNRVSFELASYDRNRAVVIDPFIIYSTFLGGTGFDVGYGIASDSIGAATVTGQTCSINFPVSSERFQGLIKGTCNAFVTKLDVNAASAPYSTYLGGSGTDRGNAVTLESGGTAFVAGATNSGDFPITANAFKKILAAGDADAFVVHLDGDGDELTYATFLGGSSNDSANGIAIDSSQNVYVTGNTSSTDFPTTATAPQPTFGGGFAQAFVTKLNPGALVQLVYSTYLGGTGGDLAFAITVDSLRNAYVTGGTGSLDFPSFPKSGPETAYQITNRGIENAFVVKYNPTGTAVIYSTLLGGTNADEGHGIAVDAGDTTGPTPGAHANAYVAGKAFSSDFVVGTVPGSFQTKSGSDDAFVAKLDDDGDALLYFSYLGGSGDDFANGLALDSLNQAWVTGRTCSTNFPTTPGAFQPVSPGVNIAPCDAFIAKFGTAGNLQTASYLGGSGFDEGNAVALDASCTAFVTGLTFSANFPHGSGAFDHVYNGGSGNAGDAFVTRIGQWTLTGRGTGLAVAGLGITGDTGKVSTFTNSSKTAFFAGVDAGLVQATLLNGSVVTDACAGKSTGDASAADVVLRLPGAPIIKARAVQADSETTCQGSTGSMNVASLQVGSAPPGGGGFPPNTIIPLGTGSALILNEQVPLTGFDKGLRVTAIHLHALGLDAVVAAAESDIKGCEKCPTGTTLCSVGGSPDLFSFCKNVKTDASNCGVCGNACPTGTPFCVASACAASCASGQIACGTSCVNPANDPMNCGACGKVCPSTAPFCSAGACHM
jgi:hypothetical protein